MSNSRHLRDTLNPKPLEVGQKLYHDGCHMGTIVQVEGSWVKVGDMDGVHWMAVNHVRERYEVK